MLWTVRGTLQRTHQDMNIVVEAGSRDEAEYMGWRRGLYVVIVEEASPDDIAAARDSRLLWRYTPETKYTAFGWPIRKLQLAGLMLVGVMTIVLLLERAGISHIIRI